ncbi:MscL family protein [Colwellia sp. BRX10-3]|uniref:MscL family protein n=1 Tax=Colwellia sp. BRX10-3 TaxID=2759844 RepID=UPI001C71084B|nr:MscL family protein [Colwellia sp. BRX10-3]
MKGNVLDIAIVVGGAFASITSSLLANVFAPTKGLFISGVDLADLFLVLKIGVQDGPYFISTCQ